MRAKKADSDTESNNNGGTKGSIDREQKRVSEFPRDDVAESSHGGGRMQPLCGSSVISTRADAKHIFARIAAVSGWHR